MKKSVTVVIPTYNQAAFLAETIESVLSQTFAADEVIVVNDGSTDATEEVLDHYQAAVSVVSTENRGVSSARNIGLERAQTDYVAFCDSDDLWHPEKLESQLERLDSTTRSQWCLCAVTLVNDSNEETGEMLNGTEGWVFENIVTLRPSTLMGGGSGVLVETRLAKAVGGFDTSLSTSADWEFYARLSINSPLTFVARPLVRYRIHQNGMHMGLKTWESDMTRSLLGLRERGLISRSLLRRAQSALDIQIAGEQWRRGSRHAAVRRGAIAVARSPRAGVDALGRRIQAT